MHNMTNIQIHNKITIQDSKIRRGKKEVQNINCVIVSSHLKYSPTFSIKLCIHPSTSVKELDGMELSNLAKHRQLKMKKNKPNFSQGAVKCSGI